MALPTPTESSKPFATYFMQKESGPDECPIFWWPFWVSFWLRGVRIQRLRYSHHHLSRITPTFTTDPKSTSEPIVHQSELISKGKLSCSSLGAFTKCADNVLNIEFENPTTWGQKRCDCIRWGFRLSAHIILAGKRSLKQNPLWQVEEAEDFSEGRGGVSTDFAGYGDTGVN